MPALRWSCTYALLCSGCLSRSGDGPSAQHTGTRVTAPYGPLSQTKGSNSLADGQVPAAHALPAGLSALAPADRSILLIAGVEISTRPDLGRGQRTAGRLLPRPHALPLQPRPRKIKAASLKHLALLRKSAL